MVSNRLGIHWIRAHPDDARDLPFARMVRPGSIKLFEEGWSNRDFCRALLDVVPSDCLFLARDHPLSEQKEDVWRDPVGTGKRHAAEWEDKVRSGRFHLPVSRTLFLGINEPDTERDRRAIDLYTVAFLDGLLGKAKRGGAFNFSTGTPRTHDGTPTGTPDYAFFENSRQAIKRGNHMAIQHIYGSADQPLVPGHYDRLRSCPWQDVTWIIGECGIDQHVTTGGPHVGFLGALRPIEAYTAWLETLFRGVNDRRIHSWQPFTYDFSHPWDTFNIREINQAVLNWNWHGFDPAPVVTPPPVKPPVVQPPPVTPGSPSIVHPLPPGTYRISQRFNQTTTNPTGHEGVDFGAAGGTPVRAIAAGVVQMVDEHPMYGKYIRVQHRALGMESFYAHLDRQDVRIGQALGANHVIGAVGTTGNSTGNHLHLEIRYGFYGDYLQVAPKAMGRIDPETWFAMQGLSLSTGAYEK